MPDLLYKIMHNLIDKYLKSSLTSYIRFSTRNLAKISQDPGYIYSRTSELLSLVLPYTRKPPFSQEKVFPDYYSRCKIALGTKDCLPKQSSSCNSSSATQEILLVEKLQGLGPGMASPITAPTPYELNPVFPR